MGNKKMKKKILTRALGLFLLAGVLGYSFRITAEGAELNLPVAEETAETRPDTDTDEVEEIPDEDATEPEEVVEEVATENPEDVVDTTEFDITDVGAFLTEDEESEEEESYDMAAWLTESKAAVSNYRMIKKGWEFNGHCYAVVGQTTVNGQTIGNGSDSSHLHVGIYTMDASTSAYMANMCGCGENHPWRTQNGYSTAGILSRNPADKVVFNNCTFYNCWTELFFDAEFNNCTFYNCTFSNNGSTNTIVFNNCNVNPGGYTGIAATQANPGVSHGNYAGIMGGLNTRWVLNHTTVCGTGATCAISDNRFGNFGSFMPGVYLLNGSRVYGGSVCAIDIWNNEGNEVEVVIDGTSQVDSAAVGIYNQGCLYLKDGSITGCLTAAIENYYQATVTGGTIYDNAGWGILNHGTATLTAGDISGNHKGGVYQNGTLYMSGDGAVDAGNAIHLTPSHVIHVTGPLNAETAGNINLAEGDRMTGRHLIQLYAADSAVGEVVTAQFTLAFTENDNRHTRDIYDSNGALVVSNGQKVASLIRPGYGTNQNAPTDRVILSGRYYASYESNLAVVAGMHVQIPYRHNEFYYGEFVLPDTPNHAFTTGEENRATVGYTTEEVGQMDISNSLKFLGWALDAAETEKSRIYTTDQVLAMYGDFRWFAIWDANFDVYFDGNKQTRGANYRVEDVTLWTPLPGNVGPSGTEKDHFAKVDTYNAKDKTWYDKNLEAYINHEVPYSYQGWSMRTDAIYTDSDVVNPTIEKKDTLGEALDIFTYNDGTAWLVQCIEKKEILGFDEAGRAIIPLYVVWDRAPTIEAYDIYTTTKEVPSLTEDDFWKTVTVTDREDGTLRNQVDVTLVGFDPKELEEIEGDRAGVSVTYRAVDGAGNVTFYTIMVNVTSNTAITSRIPNADGSMRDTANYVRFIDRENYNKSSNAAGGLEEHSVWYKNPEYVSHITKSFDNLDQKQAIVSYELDVATLQQMQKYCDGHFAEVLDSAYRKDFYNLFMKPNIVSGDI